jgi:hypothetical protein
MVSFDQHIVLAAETRLYIVILIIVLLLLVVAVSFVGVMIHQLSVVVRTQSEMLAINGRAQARKGEGKKEW